MVQNFTAADVPSQKGRTFVVTGANSGLGFETAKALAARQARVILACRSPEKAKAAADRIRLSAPDADLSILRLDLADLGSIAEAARTLQKEERLDGLINNAGVMMPPKSTTEDGFELQFGVNHLGTFALTGQLIEKLAETPGSRIVITSSIAHKGADIDFEDLDARKSYNRMQRYAQSKLANLLHMKELDRRLRAAGSGIVAVACHPGVADTELVRHLPGAFTSLVMPLARPFLNSAATGAWPTLAAATAPDVHGGQYFGPSRRREWVGPATEVKATAKARDPAIAQRLWVVSQEMTSVAYPL